MEIKVLGTGCPKCKALEANVRQALAELNLQAEVDKVTEMKKIMEYDIFMTPGLVINGKIKASGRLAATEEIKKWLEAEENK